MAALCLPLGLTLAPISSGGWDCQPGADGGWRCSAEQLESGPLSAPAETEAPPARPPVPTADPDLVADRPPPGSADGTGGTERDQTSPIDRTSTPDSSEPSRPTAKAATIPSEVTSGKTRVETAPALRFDLPGRGVTADDPAFGLHRDWERLTSLDQGLPDTVCRGWEGLRPMTPATPGVDIGTLVYAEADAAETREREGVTVLSGDVFLRSGRETLQADRVTYRRAEEAVEARGEVWIARPDLRAHGARADYRLDTGQGSIEEVEYRVLSAGARGFAQRAEFLGRGKTRYRDIQYTTCRAGNDDWLLSAGRLEIDQTEGFGVARDATLRLGGVPVLYTPWMSFPTDDRRRSGLLVPTVGSTSNTGFDLSLPYYLNLAPNYDATLTPRLMSKRGLLLGAEFRYLGERQRGEFVGEILPDDREHPGSNMRGTLRLRHYADLAPRLTSALRLNYASDADYLDDLGSSLAVTSTRVLERTGEIRYRADTWDLLGRLQYYQTVDRTIAPADRPYSRLPQLLLDLEQPDRALGLTYHLRSEYVNFHRESAERGHRLDLYPGLSLPFSNSWAYVEPKAAVRYTAYSLSNRPIGQPNSPDRLLPVLSLDGGLFYERPGSWLGEAVTQTLEPRLYYLYVPRSGQDDLPVFDTGEFDFNFDNLFRANRFNGADRHGDANRLTLALTSRSLAASDGRELFRASLGQIYHFSDRRVNLPGEPDRSDSTSALVSEFQARFAPDLRGRAGLQWDPNDGAGDITQALVQLSYRRGDRRLMNLSYRLRKDVAEQVDLAGLWPVTDRLSVIARWNHSLQESRLLEGLLGFEYGRCCWRLRLLARRFADSGIDGHNTSVLLQLELLGLGKIGDSIDSVLERGIYGYQIDAND